MVTFNDQLWSLWNERRQRSSTGLYAARLTRGARNHYLCVDQTWRWARHIAKAFSRIRAAFP